MTIYVMSNARITTNFSSRRKLSNYHEYNGSGFTFIELVLVVAIIGVLVGVSIPNLKVKYYDIMLHNSSRQMQAFMNYLSQRSVAQGEAICLAIDKEKNEYSARLKAQENSFKTQHLPRHIAIESDKEEICFYPDGKITGVDIKLSIAAGMSISLTTKGVLGGVKMRE